MTHRALAAVLLLATASPALAQAPADAGSPRMAPQEFAPTPPYREQAEARGRIVLMTVEDVVRRAIANNLDVLIERYNVQLAQQRLVGARGAYDPVFSIASTRGSTTNALTAATGATTIPTEQFDSLTGASTLRQTMPGGTSASLTVSGQRLATTNPASLLTPVYGSAVTASVTQPLLRGFIHTAPGRQVGLSELETRIAGAQYRLRITQVMQQVLNQYWELVFAIESYEARRQSKAVALLQYESASVRVQNGLLTPVALTAAQAEIASRERDLLQAQVLIINAENGLKQLLAEDPGSVIWEGSIIPSDRPAVDAPPMPLVEAQALARTRRPELEQVGLQLAQNSIDKTFFTWEARPSVNLGAAVSAVGRAGTVLQRTADGRVPDPENPAFGRFETVWRQLWNRDFPAWSFSLNVQVPIGNRTAEAQLVQARIAGERLSTQLAKLQQSVSLEAQSAWQVIAVQRKSLEAARLTARLFDQQLEAQRARYDSGFSSDFELLRYQRDLVDARVRELRALVDLQQGVIALQRATDTLLDDLKIQTPR